ncbi:MAG TPA: methyltransferase domain-containing protein [bacterium]|nr:methyltransferase domain-containing protein [bacterium]HQI49428.1 methyltransferase domain-containing protein [bacterium]HQJ65293.1 methyltransferase domain-containing protein [bacterium]
MPQKLNLQVDACDVSDFQGKLRFNFTRRFVASGITEPGEVLSIGPENAFDQAMAGVFQLGYNSTTGDLDREWRAPEKPYAYVFCFEVIEHLMNPLHFLETLQRYLQPGTRIFLSTPRRPHAFWNNQHFHEYDTLRFTHLLTSAGYEVVRHEARVTWYHPLFYLSGLRPFLRLTVGRSKTHLYELRSTAKR